MNLPYSGTKAVVATYGPSGIGKTTDLLYSFPHGLFVAPPGALKPAEKVVGFVACVYVWMPAFPYFEDVGHTAAAMLPK